MKAFVRLLPSLSIMAVVMLAAAPAYAQTDPRSLDMLMAHFIHNLSKPMTTITVTGAYIFGIYCLAKGLLKSIKYSDEGSRGQQKFSGVWGSLLFGALLCAVPSVVDTVAKTMNLDSGAYEPMLQYVNSVQDGEIKARLERTYYVILTFVQLIGIISFVRGLSILRSVTDGNTQVTSMAGITHVLAGGIAWNLGEFVQILGNTVNIAI